MALNLYNELCTKSSCETFIKAANPLEYLVSTQHAVPSCAMSGAATPTYGLANRHRTVGIPHRARLPSSRPSRGGRPRHCHRLSLLRVLLPTARLRGLARWALLTLTPLPLPPGLGLHRRLPQLLRPWRPCLLPSWRAPATRRSPRTRAAAHGVKQSCCNTLASHWDTLYAYKLNATSNPPYYPLYTPTATAAGFHSRHRVQEIATALCPPSSGAHSARGDPRPLRPPPT